MNNPDQGMSFGSFANALGQEAIYEAARLPSDALLVEVRQVIAEIIGRESAGLGHQLGTTEALISRLGHERVATALGVEGDTPVRELGIMTMGTILHSRALELDLDPATATSADIMNEEGELRRQRRVEELGLPQDSSWNTIHATADRAAVGLGPEATKAELRTAQARRDEARASHTVTVPRGPVRDLPAGEAWRANMYREA